MTDSGRWRIGAQTVNGFSQFYRDWQPREQAGLPVLALHGSLTQSGSWIALAEAAGSIRMLCPDQRGFGLSEDPGGDSCAAFVSDAIVLAQGLLPPRFAVMGHSFACSIALEVARTVPDRVAVAMLVDPVVPVRKHSVVGQHSAHSRASGNPESFSRWIPAYAGTNGRERREDFNNGSASPSIAYADSFATLADAERHFRDTEEGAWPGDTLARFTRDVMLRDGDNGPWHLPYTLERLRRLRAFTASPDSDYKLLAKAKDVRCPVLVFRGGASKRFPAEAEPLLAEAFPSKPVIVVCPASGHFPANTETAIVAGALKRFLVRAG